MTIEQQEEQDIEFGGHRGKGCTDNKYYQDIRDIQNLPVENTVESIAAAFDEGAAYVEIDAVQSADGVVFVLHNVVPKDHFFGDDIPRDLLNKMNFAEIQDYMTGRYGTGKIATLSEVLEVVAEKAPGTTPWKINIELKHLAGSSQPYEDNDFLRNVADIVAKSSLKEEDILYSGFSFHNVKEMAKISPKSHFGMLFREYQQGDETNPAAKAIYTSHQDNWQFQYQVFNEEGVDRVVDAWDDEITNGAKLIYMHPETATVTPPMMKVMKEKDLKLNTWSIFEDLTEDRKQLHRNVIADAKQNGVAMTIITDYIKEMKAAKLAA